MLKFIWFFTLVTIAWGANETGSVPHLDGRIVGGSPTTIGKHPYQVSVRVYGRHICGGSIITKQTILTAAECIMYSSRASDYSIRVGSTESNTGGKEYSVEQIIPHANYSSSSHDYDIGLIKINGCICFNSNVMMISLPKVNETIASGTMGITTGWGAIAEGGLNVNTLQVVSVPVVDDSQCSNAYRSVTARMICAGYIESGGKGACHGDSGGPFVVNGKQIGIVSWGYGCARPGYPAVYTRVAALRDWIDKNDAAKFGGVGQTTLYASMFFILISKLSLLSK